jgi:hypothetical protein
MPIHHTFNDEDNRPDFVEAGVYPATIIEAEEKLSKSSGNEMIELRWRLDSPAPLVFDYLTFGEKMGWKVDTFLKSTGTQPEKGKEVEIEAEKLVGIRAFVQLAVEDDNRGGKRNKVAKYITDKGQPPALPF